MATITIGDVLHLLGERHLLKDLLQQGVLRGEKKNGRHVGKHP
jgi:hypothetical protein